MREVPDEIRDERGRVIYKRGPNTSKKDWLSYLQNQLVIPSEDTNLYRDWDGHLRVGSPADLAAWNDELQRACMAEQKVRYDTYTALKDKGLPVPKELDPMDALVAKHTDEMGWTDWDALEKDEALEALVRASDPRPATPPLPEAPMARTGLQVALDATYFILGLGIVIAYVLLGVGSPVLLILGAAMMGWPAFKNTPVPDRDPQERKGMSPALYF